MRCGRDIVDIFNGAVLLMASSRITQKSPSPGRGVVSTYTLFVPLIQLNYRAQDRPSSFGGLEGGIGSNNNNNNNINDNDSSGDQGGLTLGTKVGIGIGAASALIITGLLLFFRRRALQRRRGQNRPIEEMLPDEKKGHPWPTGAGGGPRLMNWVTHQIRRSCLLLVMVVLQAQLSAAGVRGRKGSGAGREDARGKQCGHLAAMRMLNMRPDSN
ncbi:hypothetical protein PpBr36_07505 [Pyricularia pennisetigena]|uniref:hypothetical protein n=1 Tax=Pyricularia pennisetigena TaxID=1578925 RepID=UPI001154C1D8|nr:hypothetical protein PpBr36_07505 [Pyricularia pennisetigena]TLS24955.1 hypothetical protein PpBr36_07505 [Pyricularia pennisetigena]